MNKLCLNQSWRLWEAPLNWDRAMLGRVLDQTEGWMDCALPCDVHMPLEAYGRVKDVVKADYCFEAEWTAERSWWFVKTFEGGTAANDEVVELTLESLDAAADVFLNGVWLGEHQSAHYPFVKGVKDVLKAGENTLVVRLTTGMENVDDKKLAELEKFYHTEERGDDRRCFVRKAQYTVGWDWGPKALTCGIVKNAYVKSYNKTAIRGVHLETVQTNADGGAAELKLHLEVEQLDVVKTRDADVAVALSFAGVECARASLTDVLLTSGINYLDLDITLPAAKLWWPNGYGEQPLYQVAIQVACEGAVEEYPLFDYGVRTVKLDTRRTSLAENTRLFALIVNGVRVYCKGGDWIPSDSIYARVTDEKYHTLIEEAKNANFNMLRIWGGGCYEFDVFYNTCDRLGILLWHDFMFACATYPDHLDEFVLECDREFDYQTRRLRNHACLGILSGNNENHMIFGAIKGLRYEKQYGLKLANNESKRYAHLNCANIPYWNSSPYGGAYANANNIGNVHHWNACMMNPDMAKRIEPKEYDLVQARFVTEYGYPGPCPMESIEDYFDGKPVERGGRIWELHNNTFEKKTVNAGIEKHYLDHADQLSLPDYILYAGMVQSTMLGYSLEAMRFKDYMSGSLFWMYNDTWGEVGWTIVDYYLRRKISYYGVKRAFAPVKLTMRADHGKVKLQGINDTPETISFACKLGYLPFDGSEAKLAEASFTLAPRSREYLMEAELPDADYTLGTYVVLPEGDTVAPAALRLYDMRCLKLAGAAVETVSARDEGNDLLVTLTAKAYIHGVHFEETYKADDNYFDLLPGQVKTVRIAGAAGQKIAWHTVR